MCGSHLVRFLPFLVKLITPPHSAANGRDFVASVAKGCNSSGDRGGRHAESCTNLLCRALSFTDHGEKVGKPLLNLT